MKCTLIVAGLGTVGQDLLRLLYRRRKSGDEEEIQFRVMAAADTSGNLYDLDGIDESRVLEAKEQGRGVASCSLSRIGQNIPRLLEIAPAHIYVDCLPADEPMAGTYARMALERGMAVVTANKSWLAPGLCEMKALAERVHRPLLYSAAADAGLPGSLAMGEALAAGHQLTGFAGVFSSTCSFVLERISGGMTAEAAVDAARKAGLTEGDASADLSGWDTAVKAAIHAETFWPGLGLTPEDFVRQPLDASIEAQVSDAAARGRVWRYAAVCHPAAGEYRVGPVCFSPDHPLGEGKTGGKALVFETESLGNLLCKSSGCEHAAAETLLADLWTVARLVKGRR